MRRALAVALLAAVCVALAGTGAARAQGTVEVRANSARSDFPNGISFSLDAAVSGALDDARLVYEIAPAAGRATAAPQCPGGAVVNCRFQLAGSGRALLIPGAEVSYFWRVTVGGATEETSPQTVVYEDDRFEWRTVNEGNLTLWYYSGGEGRARAVLAARRERLPRIP